MRKIEEEEIKVGDWILVRKPPYPKNDKTHTIIIVKEESLKYCAFNWKGEMELIEGGKRNHLTDSIGFYPKEWGTYKLNKKEREALNKKMMLHNLK